MTQPIDLLKRIGPAKPGPTDPAIIDLVEKSYRNDKERVKMKLCNIEFSAAQMEAGKKMYEVWREALFNIQSKWKYLNRDHKAAWVALTRGGAPRREESASKKNSPKSEIRR